MPTRDLQGFIEATDRLIERMPRAHLRLQIDIATEAFRDLVDNSPVRTGAYQASHTVTGPGGEVFSDPARPDPDEPILGSQRIFEVPRVEDARAAMEAGLEPFGRIEIENRRFYAGFLEYGTPTAAPRAIYAGAAANAASRAERLAPFGIDLGDER